MSDEQIGGAATDEVPTLTKTEERAAVQAQAAADKAEAAAVKEADAAAAAQAQADEAEAAAEAARDAIALTYDPTKPGAGGVPRRDLTVQEAEVYLGTREAVAGLCAYGAYTPTDALPAALRPHTKPEKE